MKVKFQLFGFLFLVATTIYWNVSAKIRVSQQSAVCRDLEEELADWNDKVKALNDWSGQRTSATFNAVRDRRQLFRMYRVCRSVNDFVAIYPDQIQSVSSWFGGRDFQILFYLPKGKHQLGVRFSELGAEEARTQSDPELPSFWDGPEEKLLSLEGGKSYRASISFRHGNEPATPMKEPVSSIRVSISEEEFIEFPFELSSVTSFSDYSGQMGLGLPNQIPNSFFGKLYLPSGKLSYPRKDFDLTNRGYEVWRKSDNEKRVIRLGLFIRSEGPACILPTNTRLCADVFGSGKLQRSLKHLQFDDANGWYYYPNPAESDPVEAALD